MSSMERLALTTLQIVNDRIFPHQRRTYSDWNEPPELRPVREPFVLPIGPQRSQGFTAVVLTYDRLESLFRVLERLAATPSLVKMVVVWNNQQKEPPPISSWPRLPKPLQVTIISQIGVRNLLFFVEKLFYFHYLEFSFVTPTFWDWQCIISNLILNIHRSRKVQGSRPCI